MTSGQQLALTITMYLNSRKHAYNSKASSRSVVLPTARKRAWRPVDALDELAVCFVGLPGMPGSKNQLVREPTIGRKLTDNVSLEGRPHRNRTSTDIPALRARLHVTVKKLTIFVTEHPF
jgi:hypothetical protein